MILALLVGVVMGFIGSIPLAGPTSFLVLKNALEKGKREGFDIAVGAAAAETVYAFVALWGLTSALVRFPSLASIARVLGAVLIIVIGVYLVRRRSTERTREKETEKDHQGRRWVRGFASAIFNPTLIVTWTTVVTALHATSLVEMRPANALPFALGVGAGITGWFAILVKIVQRFRDHIENGGLDRIVRAMGWSMIAIGAIVASRALLRLQSL
jgi:threonine/homoserine/homoserine lactone efflux protein